MFKYVQVWFYLIALIFGLYGVLSGDPDLGGRIISSLISVLSANAAILKWKLINKYNDI